MKRAFMHLTFAALLASAACKSAAVVKPTDPLAYDPTNAGATQSSPATSDPALQQLKADVDYLGSPTLRGRRVGTAGGQSALKYILHQYVALRLTGLFSVCVSATICTIRMTQPFTVGLAQANNVGVKIFGTDSTLRNEYVVVGAHYDHIGTSSGQSRDPKAGAAVRPGADDNASGSAAVLELARRFAAHPTRRSIILLNFDAEEEGLLGSAFFVRNLPVPRGSMVLMVNLDMVGRLRKNELFADKSVLGLGETRIPEVLDSITKSRGVALKYIRTIDGRSDHTSFEHVLVPALALFTGFHDDYHTADDVLSKLNVTGMSEVADITESLVRFAADRTDKRR